MLSHIVHQSFIKGLNKGVDPKNISDQELSDGRNMAITSGGKLQTRPGTEVVRNLHAISLYRFYQKSLDRKIEVATGDTNIYHDGTAIFTACTPDQKFKFENYHDTLYMVNKEDGLLKDDGTEVTNVTGDALADFKLIDVTQNQECLYVTDGDFIWESDLGNPDHFDGNSFKRIPVTDGASVQRIKSHISGNLLAYTDNDVFVFRGSGDSGVGMLAANTYTLDSIGTGLGLIALDTLITVEGNHVGLSSEGLFECTGSQLNIFPGWDKVKPIFDDADPEKLGEAVATYHDRKIYISFASYGSEVNDKTIVFDLNKGCYYPEYEGFSVMSYCPFKGQGDTGELYFTDGTDICKFNPDIDTDKGTLINAYGVTKEFNYGDQAAPDKFKKAKVRLGQGSGSVNFYYAIDGSSFVGPQVLNGSSTVVWGAPATWSSLIKWGQGLGDKELKATLTGAGNVRKGKYIKYKVQKSGRFELQAIIPFFRPKKAK